MAHINTRLARGEAMLDMSKLVAAAPISSELFGEDFQRANRERLHVAAAITAPGAQSRGPLGRT